MQQYSSLPEQNAQQNRTQKLLTAIEQLNAQLWLERSLNSLQQRLNNCLTAAFAVDKQTIEAQIYQTVVDELNTALKQNRVVIATVESPTHCKIDYVSVSSSHHSQSGWGSIFKNGKNLHLKLQDNIETQDLLLLSTQYPQSAWPIDDCGRAIAWLILAPNPTSEALTLQLMAEAASQCNTVLAHSRQIQLSQQARYQLEADSQKLEQINQIKNQFLANTSHEIRSPLSSIIGFTHLLLAQGYNPGKERHQEYLNIIQSSGRHLLDLINDILDLSKIEANQMEVHWETVEVLPLCRTVFALIKEKAASKGLQLRLDIDPEINTLIADPLRLKQMLLNLLFNALKFTDSGSVGLLVKPQNQFLSFQVWDTGSGISLSYQAQLFQPYFQISNPSQREEGTGLGLSLTRKLAELHGGWVTVESEIDKGSRFTIVLPLVAGEAVEAKPLASVDVVDTLTSHSSDILLVEDNLPNAQMIKAYLTHLGYQVIWVANANTMWTELSQKKPALILMDILLPDANGLSLVQQLQAHPQYQNIPIIAQTAMAMKGDRETCLAAGAKDYISKPIELPLLAELISQYIRPVADEMI